MRTQTKAQRLVNRLKVWADYLEQENADRTLSELLHEAARELAKSLKPTADCEACAIERPGADDA